MQIKEMQRADKKLQDTKGNEHKITEKRINKRKAKSRNDTKIT